MHDTCDLCQSSQLQFAYHPPTTARGLGVYVCKTCGLVQSLPRVDHVDRRRAAASSGADFGNIRYGKGFRTDYAVNLLSRALDWASVRACLDVGANRGSFVQRLLQLAPQAAIWAVEPDIAVVNEYAEVPQIRLIIDRIESVPLPDERFDLVYCSHTLEHLRSPKRTLEQIWTSMTPDGILFIEVPNLELIGRDDVVEEWFIDKHLYHFSRPTLSQYLQSLGFEAVEALSTVDMENITFVAVRTPEALSLKGHKPSHDPCDLISGYETTLRRNQSLLKQTADRVRSLAGSKRIVIWGAGRIFDSLVTHGELDVTCLAGVVDKHLATFLPSVHGCSLKQPSEITQIDPDIVLIASRAYQSEITQELQQLAPNCEILTFTDLHL